MCDILSVDVHSFLPTLNEGRGCTPEVLVSGPGSSTLDGLPVLPRLHEEQVTRDVGGRKTWSPYALFIMLELSFPDRARVLKPPRSSGVVKKKESCDVDEGEEMAQACQVMISWPI